MTLLASIAFLLSSAAANTTTTAPQLSEQAQAAAQAGRGDEAERLWKQALALNPKYFPAAFNLGLYYFNTRQWQPAAQMLARAAQLNAAEFNPHYLAGGALARLNKTDDALRHWRAALAIKPDHAKLLQLMAVEYSKGRYFQEAAQTARRVVELTPADPNTWFLAIKTAQDAGDGDAAFALAEQAAARFPDSARANLELGFHLGKRGDVEKAVALLEKAMRQDPRYEEPFFFYADLMVKQGNHKEAVDPLRRAIAIRPDYVPARVLLSRALMNLEQWQEAMTELQAAIAQDPKHPQPHLLLSQIYFRLGDEEKAASEKALSLRLRRENPTVLEAVQGRPFPESR